MPPEPGPFQAFYYSSLQHPLLLWLAALAALGVVLARPGLHPGLRRYALALVALSALDAWLTSSPVPGLGALPAGLAGVVPLLFVLAGDFRYLLLAFAATPDGRLAPGAPEIALAVAATLVVPVLAQGGVSLLGGDQRTLFLVYEVAFFALVAALRALHPRLRAAPWLRSISAFVMLYYGLWASADAILLAAGSELGWALRVIPNLLYYGGFIAALAWLAPVRRP